MGKAIQTSLLVSALLVSFFEGKGQTTLRDSIYQGFDAIYDFRFHEAKRLDNHFSTHRPDHPWGNLFSANYAWWQIISGNDSPELRTKLHTHSDRIINTLKPSKEDLSHEDLHVLISAYAFKSRVELLDNNYIKSVRRMNSAIGLIKRSLGHEDDYVWFNLTSGLYNYYVEFARTHHPYLRPYLAFLPKGDRQKGLRQLGTGHASSDPLLSVESNYFLLKIHFIDGEEELDLVKGVRFAEQLNDRHPANLLFLYYRFKVVLASSGYDKAMEILNQLKEAAIANRQLSQDQRTHFLEIAKEDLKGHFADKRDP